jgi:methyltransferase (TIGR00027 family)
MRLPNLSHMLRVAQFRYVQSVYEPVELRNPDNFAGDLLSLPQRLACDLYGKFFLRSLRRSHRGPFYYYLLARTKYYDSVFLNAVEGNLVRYVVNIGCGGDTRPYRFAKMIREQRVQVLECDQPDASRKKQELVRRLWPADNVDFLGIDLNDESWPQLQQWFLGRQPAPTLVMLEGVSPYVDSRTFGLFLEFLSEILPANSTVAYDFKISGVNDDWGKGNASMLSMFRLPSDHSDIARYHEDRGFSIEFLESSADLTTRLLPSLDTSVTPLFLEDGLVRMRPIEHV